MEEPNPPENRNINTGRGNYNERIKGDHAEEQPDYPVPVLFNFSSWKDDRQSITNWLVAELKSKYGVINRKQCLETTNSFVG